MADEILVLILNTTRATLSFTVCVCVYLHTESYFRLTYTDTHHKLLPFIAYLRAA